MSTVSTTVSETRPPQLRAVAAADVPRGVVSELFLPAYTLWLREVVRFYRMRSRVVGVIASPVMFWLVLGSGFGSSLRTSSSGSSQHYLDYFYPGALLMIVLFTSIFTMMSVIEDRREGFLLSVLVSPARRAAIVLGKVLGGATLSFAQGVIFLLFAPLVGAHMRIAQIVLAALAIFLVAFSLTALGFAIAWRLDSTQAFHAIINLFLIPLWLLSGALFPLAGASAWMRALMFANPLTYGVEALRSALYTGGEATSTGLSVSLSLSILGGFCLLMFLASLVMVNRRRTLPA